MSPIEVFLDSLDMPIRIGSLVMSYSWMDIILKFVVPLVVLLLASIFFMRWLRSYIARTSLTEERKARLIKGFRLGVRLVFVLVVLLLLSAFLEDRIILFVEGGIRVISTPFLTLGSMKLSILHFLLAFPLIYLANLSGKAVRLAFERSRMFNHSIAENRRHSIANFIRYAVTFIGLMIGAGLLGIDLSGFLILLSIIGFAIAIGLYSLLSNFIAGLTISLTRQIKEGDVIRIKLPTGTKQLRVKSLRLINSLMSNEDEEITVVPNASLVYSPIVNLSLRDEAPRISATFAVDFGEDVDRAREAILEGIKKQVWVSLEIAPDVLIENFGSRGVELKVRVALNMAQDAEEARHELNKVVWRALRDRSIRMVGKDPESAS